MLDGDELRALVPSLLFDDTSRTRFYEIVGQLAALLARQGLTVLVPATAHRRALRARARELAPRFVEVYVTTPLAECERRDHRGLYARARRGDPLHLPGVGEPYERPDRAEVLAAGGEDEGAVREVLIAVEG
jgi:adenylylsulfate kinase